jgi:hypothetical protein
MLDVTPVTPTAARPALEGSKFDLSFSNAFLLDGDCRLFGSDTFNRSQAGHSYKKLMELRS